MAGVWGAFRHPSLNVFLPSKLTAIYWARAGLGNCSLSKVEVSSVVIYAQLCK